MTLRGASDCVFWFSVRRQPKPSPQGGRTQAGVKGDGGAFGMVHRSTLSNSWGQRVPDAISVRASGRVRPGAPFQIAGASESRTRSASGRAVGSGQGHPFKRLGPASPGRDQRPGERSGHYSPWA